MGSTRIRPAIPVAGVVCVAAALGLRLAGLVSAHEAERLQGHMVAVAAKLDDPAGLLTRPRRTCSSQEHLVRCLEGDQDPDTLAAGYQRALSSVAGRPAELRCETLRFGERRPRSCLVRLDDGAHAVLVSIDSRAIHTPLGITLSGSDVRVDAT
jgi:hypothetical protein